MRMVKIKDNQGKLIEVDIIKFKNIFSFHKYIICDLFSNLHEKI